MSVDTPEREAITPDQMLAIVRDWIGDCRSEPGNTDVIDVLLDCGVSRRRVAELATLVARAQWSPFAVGSVIVELLSGNRRLRSAIVRHGQTHHKLTRSAAKRDLGELEAEARILVQRELISQFREKVNGASR